MYMYSKNIFWLIFILILNFRVYNNKENENEKDKQT